MRKLMIGALALAGVAIAAPASAQGFYFGAPGVSVGVGAPVHRHYDGPVYHSYDHDRPRYRAHRHRDYDRSYAYGGCRTVTIQRDDGSVKRIRRCG